MGRLRLRVRPGGRRTSLSGWYGDLPKLEVVSPPVDGAANEAVVLAVAKLLELRPRQVRLVGGRASRTKHLEIDGFTDEDILERIVALNPR